MQHGAPGDGKSVALRLDCRILYHYDEIRSKAAQKEYDTDLKDFEKKKSEAALGGEDPPPGSHAGFLVFPQVVYHRCDEVQAHGSSKCISSFRLGSARVSVSVLAHITTDSGCNGCHVDNAFAFFKKNGMCQKPGSGCGFFTTVCVDCSREVCDAVCLPRLFTSSWNLMLRLHQGCPLF